MEQCALPDRRHSPAIVPRAADFSDRTGILPQREACERSTQQFLVMLPTTKGVRERFLLVLRSMQGTLTISAAAC